MSTPTESRQKLAPLAILFAALLSLLALLLWPKLTRVQQAKAQAEAVAQAAVPTFVPELLGIDLVPGTLVRPGDQLAYTLRFVNRGTLPAKHDETVFVHFEPKGSDCKHITFQQDHDLRLPTRMWQPGEPVFDGPRVVPLPLDAAEGEYQIHIGIYDRDGDHERSCEAMAGTIRVAKDAPLSSAWKPEPLAAEELPRRRAALAARIAAPVKLQGEGWSFTLDKQSGAFLLEDERTHVVWSSNPDSTRFGRVRWKNGERAVDLPIERFDSVELVGGDAAGSKSAARELVARSTIHCAGQTLTGSVEIHAALAHEGPGLRLTAIVRPPEGWETDSVTLLDHALMTTDADAGYTIAPNWLGQLKPASSGMPTDRWYGPDDVSMAMSGAVKQGSALLVAWMHPDARLVLHTSIEDSPLVAGRRAQSMSLELGGRTSEIALVPLGAGGYPEIALAYRAIAEKRGLRSTWIEKRAIDPELELLEGAPEFRFSGLSRIAPASRYNSTANIKTRVDTTFEEIARCARHWREDLGIDRAQVLVSGWNRDGYDRGHPDILPANPECGGDTGLAAASCAIRELGFVFTLHDNYVDMYFDSPSWNPALVALGASGEMRQGGDWLGGRPFRVCGEAQLGFARRNLPEVWERFHPQAYFLDSTLTAPLETCSDPAHPMTRWDNQRWRSELFRFARKQIGMVGLEGGREWAVPDAHWFEGMLTQKTVHVPEWVVVPIFLFAYGDCVSLLPMQADKLGTRDARKVLDLAVCGQMPSYAFGPHAYHERTAKSALPVRPELVRFIGNSSTNFRMLLNWKVSGDIHEDATAFVHFIRPGAKAPEGIVFQYDMQPKKPVSTWMAGDVVASGGTAVIIPASEADEDEWEVRVGLARNGERLILEGLDAEDGRVSVGVLRRVAGQLTLDTSSSTAEASFCRADHGWAAGFGSTDRMIKNTWEVLTWLNRMVVTRGLTAHRFVSADRSVEQSEFGDVKVTVNYGEKPYEIGGATLPQYGLLIESPSYIAFHATRWGGREYPDGALFTLRALDGGRLDQAQKIRVFHGFGDAHVNVAGKTIEVEREATVAGPGAR